jgi:hypothetical protein
VCILALVIRHAKRMHCVILTPVACLALPHISTLYHEQHHFGWGELNIKCVFWFSLQFLPETFLILRTEQDIIKYINWSSCKVPVILVNFNETWILTDFLKYQVSMKICPVGATQMNRHDEANRCLLQLCECT